MGLGSERFHQRDLSCILPCLPSLSRTPSGDLWKRTHEWVWEGAPTNPRDSEPSHRPTLALSEFVKSIAVLLLPTFLVAALLLLCSFKSKVVLVFCLSAEGFATLQNSVSGGLAFEIWLHVSSQLLSLATWHWSLDIGHGRSIYTTEIGSCFKSALSLPQWEPVIKHSPVHHWISSFGCLVTSAV